MNEEELEFKHINPAMKNFGLICVTMLIIGGLVVAGILIFNQLAASIISDPTEIQQQAHTNQ